MKMNLQQVLPIYWSLFVWVAAAVGQHIIFAAALQQEEQNVCDCPTNENCLEVRLDRYSGNNPPIDWGLHSATQPLASGQLSGNATHATACIKDFRCANFRVSIPTRNETKEKGIFQLTLNGVVWAEEPFHIDTYGFVYDPTVPLAWIGEHCHYGYPVCGDEGSLLDVQLTTLRNATEESVYWRVYSKFKGQRGNLLHDPYFRKYRPNTTYRTLQCIPNTEACTELGYKNFSLFSNLTIRMDGKTKTKRRWMCVEGLCEGDIVTPIRGCSLIQNPAVTSILGSVVSAAFLLIGFLVWYYKYQSKLTCMGEDTLIIGLLILILMLLVTLLSSQWL